MMVMMTGPSIDIFNQVVRGSSEADHRDRDGRVAPAEEITVPSFSIFKSS